MGLTVQEVYHVAAEGNHGQTLFFSEVEYRFFLHHFERLIRPICQVRLGVLLPNRVHFILQTTPESVVAIRHGSLTLQALTNGFRILLSSYSAWQNSRYQQTGSWFRQRTQFVRLPGEASNQQKEVWLRNLPASMNLVEPGCVWPYWIEGEFQATRSEVRSPQTRVASGELQDEKTEKSPNSVTPMIESYWPTRFPPYPIPGYHSHPWLRGPDRSAGLTP